MHVDRRAFIALPFFSPLIAAATRPVSTTRDIDVDLEVTKVPGIAAAGDIDGKPFQLAAGVCEAGRPAPVTIDTVFPAASLTKTVFAMAIRSLVRDGKLEWDKPLQDYTDLGLTGDARQITASHVLTHTTGLVNWRFQADQPLVSAFPPGTRWQYSGEGVFLLQRVVEAITALSAAVVVRQRVLDPLGMSSSTLLRRRTASAAAVAGHDRGGAKMEKSLDFYEQKNLDILEKAGIDNESATYEQVAAAYAKAGAAVLPIAMNPNMAGSLRTTARDFAKYLRRTLIETATSPDDFSPRAKVNGAISWSRGWGVDGSSASRAWFHMGDAPGYKAFAWVEPRRKACVAFFTNAERGAALYGWELRKALGRDSAALYWW